MVDPRQRRWDILGGALAASLCLTLFTHYVGTVNAAGNAQKMGEPKVQTVTAADDVALDANVAAGVTPVMICVDNEDGTNFIRVGKNVDVTASIKGTKILPGQSKCFPGAQTFYARASTADVSVTVTAFGPGL